MRTKSPQAERARVGDHEAAHDLVDEAARPERDHQAEEHADAFERVGLAAGQVGIRHRERQQPHQRRREPPRRLRRLRDRSSASGAARFDGAEPDRDQPGR